MHLLKCLSLKIFLCQIVFFLFSAFAEETSNNKTNHRFPVPVHVQFSVNSTVSKHNAGISEPITSVSNRSVAALSQVPIINNRFPIPPSMTDRKDEILDKKTEDNIWRNAKSIRTNSDKNFSPSFQPGGNNGGIFGHTSSFITTAPSIVLYKPAPSYMRPTVRPTEMGTYTTMRPYLPIVTMTTAPGTTASPVFTTGRPLASTTFGPIPTTFRPIFTTFRPIPETTFRPIPSTTFRPIPTTTFRPIPTTTFRPIPTTTFRPILTTTFRPIPTTTFRPISTAAPPTSGSTFVPIIGVEEEDYEDEEEEDTPVIPEGSVGRMLLTGLKKRKGGSRKKNSNGLARQSSTKTRPAARAMNFQGDQNVVTDFVFSDIKCYRTKSREFFGATIHMKNGYHVPYIRDRPQDPLTSSDCKMDRLDTPDVRYRIAATDLRACGVEQCGDSFCLSMVFPRVPTLALADDEVTTIKCLPQQSSIAETQAISFSGDNLENRRSSSTVEGGGQDFAAEVGIFRQNPGTTNGLYAKRVSSGGVVQLGEPLQLRSVVRGGDGWSHSMLSDVKVWRMREGYNQNMERLSTNEASEVITLVDAYGCRNPEYELIAESHPVRDSRNHLVHHFTFRAFLFRGQRANEPLIVTAKVQACQEEGECRPGDCMGRSSEPEVARYKRAIEHHNASSIIHDYDSQLALHVVGRRDDPASITQKATPPPAPINTIPASTENESFTCNEKMAFSAVGGACIMLFLSGIVACLLFYSISNKRAAALKNSEIKSEASLPTQTIDNIIKRNKPLPPTPVDYSNLITATAAEGPLQRNDRFGNSSRRSYHSRGNTEGNLYTCEYECINEPRSKNTSNSTAQEDGVVIVYCCNKDKKKRGGSTSAPSSLRGTHSKKHGRSSRHKFERFHTMEGVDTEESEESYANEKPRHRTVRDVKRNHHKQRSSGIRRRISSIYREVYGRHCGGSIPARISSKNIYGSTRRKKIYYRDDNSKDIYSSSGLSSDMDSSVYCESVCSKHSDVTKCTRPYGAALNRRVEADFYFNVSNNNNIKDANRNIKSSKPLPPTPGTEILANIFPPDGIVPAPNEFLAPALPPKTPRLDAMEETPITITLPETNV